MNRGNLLVLLASLVLAGLVAWIGTAWVERRFGGEPAPPPMVDVIVAAKDIPIDTKIDASHVRIVKMPPASAPAGHLSKTEQVIGKRLKEAVYAGDLVLTKRLLDDNAISILSVTLTPGMRAVAVRVDDIIGVSGFILPGSRVDVIASGGGRGVRTVLENIKVLSVGQALTAEGGTLKAGSVTLEVDPRQAEILMEATESGSVRLALRSQREEPPSESGPSVVESPPLPTPPASPETVPSAQKQPPPTSVQVIKGKSIKEKFYVANDLTVQARYSPQGVNEKGKSSVFSETPPNTADQARDDSTSEEPKP